MSATQRANRVSKSMPGTSAQVWPTSESIRATVQFSIASSSVGPVSGQSSSGFWNVNYQNISKPVSGWSFSQSILPTFTAYNFQATLRGFELLLTKLWSGSNSKLTLAGTGSLQYLGPVDRLIRISVRSTAANQAFHNRELSNQRGTYVPQLANYSRCCDGYTPRLWKGIHPLS